MPDQQVVDLTHLDLIVASDFDMSNTILTTSAHRLCVLSLSRPAATSKRSSGKRGLVADDVNADHSHATRAMDIASRRHEQALSL